MALDAKGKIFEADVAHTGGSGTACAATGLTSGYSAALELDASNLALTAAMFTVIVEKAGTGADLRATLELSTDGTNYRQIAVVEFQKEVKGVQSVGIGRYLAMFKRTPANVQCRIGLFVTADPGGGTDSDWDTVGCWIGADETTIYGQKASDGSVVD